MRSPAFILFSGRSRARDEERNLFFRKFLYYFFFGGYFSIDFFTMSSSFP
jgi:hypothetical protein